MSGGIGSDVFEFLSNATGDSRITDFNVKNDSIELSSLNVVNSSYSDLFINKGGLELDNGGSITFEDLSLSQWDQVVDIWG